MVSRNASRTPPKNAENSAVSTETQKKLPEIRQLLLTASDRSLSAGPDAHAAARSVGGGGSTRTGAPARYQRYRILKKNVFALWGAFEYPV